MELDPVRVDVEGTLQGTVATLYSHLVTRPTGRAVRLAIETQLPTDGDHVLSLVDFSRVRVLDFSCADEIVAKLVKGSLEEKEGPISFYLFRGIEEGHLDPIDTVLRRQALAAVVELVDGGCRLLGTRSPKEGRMWAEVEAAEILSGSRLRRRFPEPEARKMLELLVRRRLVFPLEDGGCRALSSLVSEVP